ncbi:carbohydrate kinase family protein [Streptomyces violascens]|uniref:Sugar kinase n=1 Tax=Streptomyces violascens TaxID=67381 RepID=A0ABQ3QJC6_9ACTN|nr:PfkB family carbohydrate kinase [Streptomyces violascens]GGT96187.1 sugar kinase [Streptomyces violascens]GHI37381.1 sugar kinase [Streptomyces violascens]
MSGAGGGRAGGGLLVVGDVVTDVVARHRGPLAPATDTPADIRTVPGGAGANAACWAAHSGCPDVRLLARVGRDSAAWHDLRLRRSGVRPLLIPDADAPTATVIALVDTATAERTFLTDSGAVHRMNPADWSPDLLDGIAHLHLSGYLLFADQSRQLALAARESARQAGVIVSLDPASTGFIGDLGVERFLAATEGVDVLLPNADEAAFLTGLPEPADAAAKLSRQFPLVAVTLGAAGALVATGGEVVAKVAAPKVVALDSTGAGDAFTGAFLAARLSGASPAEAATAGCRAGALAVGVVGGRPEVGGG